MQKRKLGRSNLEVSAIGFACMGMSFGYGPAKDEQEMVSVIRSAVDLGDIEDAASQITVQGHRYSEGSEQMVDR
jgi:predicted aldo/keto reductase-like oxidoreductase